MLGHSGGTAETCRDAEPAASKGQPKNLLRLDLRVVVGRHLNLDPSPCLPATWLGREALLAKLCRDAVREPSLARDDSKFVLDLESHILRNGLTVPGRRCGQRSSRSSAPTSTQDQPEAPHLSQLHAFRSNTRGRGKASKWPSARVIRPAPVCRGTSSKSATPSLFGQSGHGHGNCR